MHMCLYLFTGRILVPINTTRLRIAFSVLLIVFTDTGHVPQEKYEEAIPLLEKALAIRIETLGDHEDTVRTNDYLQDAREAQVRSRREA